MHEASSALCRSPPWQCLDRSARIPARVSMCRAVRMTRRTSVCGQHLGLQAVLSTGWSLRRYAAEAQQKRVLALLELVPVAQCTQEPLSATVAEHVQ